MGGFFIAPVFIPLTSDKRPTDNVTKDNKQTSVNKQQSETVVHAGNCSPAFSTSN